MGDETLSERDFFRARDTKPLTLFQGLHKGSSLEEAIMGTHVKPGKSAPHAPDIQAAPYQIGSDDIRYFKFSASGRLQLGRNLDGLGVTEIKTGNSPI